MATLRATLGNRAWLDAHRPELRELLPEDWTHASNLNGLQIGFKLKLLDVDWRTNDEFAMVMVFLERVGILERAGELVRRAPLSTALIPQRKRRPRRWHTTPKSGKQPPCSGWHSKSSGGSSAAGRTTSPTA